MPVNAPHEQQILLRRNPYCVMLDESSDSYCVFWGIHEGKDFRPLYFLAEVARTPNQEWFRDRQYTRAKTLCRICEAALGKEPMQLHHEPILQALLSVSQHPRAHIKSILQGLDDARSASNVGSLVWYQDVEAVIKQTRDYCQDT